MTSLNNHSRRILFTLGLVLGVLGLSLAGWRVAASRGVKIGNYAGAKNPARPAQPVAQRRTAGGPNLGFSALGERGFDFRAGASAPTSPLSSLMMDPTISWLRFLGGAGTDNGFLSLSAVDAAGNLYVAGISSASWGAPVVRPYSGAGDGFVAKVDPSGALVWVSFLGGTSVDNANGLALDSSGNIYVVGKTEGAEWGTPVAGMAYNSQNDAYVAKLDPNGNLLWNAFIGVRVADGGTGQNEQGVSIAVDSSGNIFAGGLALSTLRLNGMNPARSGAGGGDGWIAKLDPSGVMQWNTFLGGSGSASLDMPVGLAVDDSGNVFAVNSADRTWGNEPTPVESFHGGFDVYVAKFNANTGALTAIRYLGNPNGCCNIGEFGSGVTVGGGNVFITGRSLTQFGPAVNPHSAPGTLVDAFVAKLDANLGLTWTTFIGGASSSENATKLALDASGNIWMAGNSNGTFGSPARAYTGLSDGMAVKLSPSGSLLWHAFFGGTGNDQGLDIAIGGSTVYLIGSSDSTWDSPLAGGGYGGGSSDLWVQQILDGVVDNDSDDDGINDDVDNCPNHANPGQENNDGDAEGDACDSDDDNDGVPDTNDAFPFNPAESVDTDGDGIGNNADSDDDNDGQSDADEIACGSNPLSAASKATDTDGDNSPNCVDADDDNDGQPDSYETACGSDPLNAASKSTDTDNDGVPNCLDLDDDNDGVPDTSDAFPLDPNESVDTDGDGIGNNADTDDDNDGQSDAHEIACGSNPLSAASKATDTDGDNLPDCVDADDDNDGIPDASDSCPLIPYSIPVASITGPATGSIYAVGTLVTFNGSFTDTSNGTHTAAWAVDATPVNGTVTVNEMAKTVSATHTFTAAGVYKVTLSVAAACGGSNTTELIDGMTALVVVYDPNAGYVVGHGWITSPVGAYVPLPSLTGKAKFGFESKYANGASTPTGKTKFSFSIKENNPKTDFEFSSTDYEWLVVAGARAQYKGTGTITLKTGNNQTVESNCRFMLTAIDGALPGGGGTDKFRIRIWDSNGGLVYDNQLNAPDSADPTTVLGGGNIVIHK